MSIKDSINQVIHIKIKDKIRVAGNVAAIAGLVILLFNLNHPVGYQRLSDWTEWSFLILAGTIISLVGIAGILHNRIDYKILQILDFIWICGSAVGVVLAFVVMIQNTAADQRKLLQNEIENNITSEKQLLFKEYNSACSENQKVLGNLCVKLKILATFFESYPTQLSIRKIDLFCLREVNVSASPVNPEPLIKLCENARNTANLLRSPILQENGNFLLLAYINQWPFFLFPLISIRFVKSFAEVFWNKSQKFSTVSLSTDTNL